jgi:hypothetical protein
MAISLARSIAAHAKRDPVFRRRVIAELCRQLACAIPKTERWYKISKAVQVFEKMK